MVDETLDVRLQENFKKQHEVLTISKNKKNNLIDNGKKKINKKFANDVIVDDEKKPRDKVKKIKINLKPDPTP